MPEPTDEVEQGEPTQPLTIAFNWPDETFERYASRLESAPIPENPTQLADYMIEGLPDLDIWAVRNTSLYVPSLAEAFRSRRLSFSDAAVERIAHDFVWSDHTGAAVDKIAERLKRLLAADPVVVTAEAMAQVESRANLVATFDVAPEARPAIVDGTIRAYAILHTMRIDFMPTGNGGDVERVSYVLDRNDLDQLKSEIDRAMAAEDLLIETLAVDGISLWKPWEGSEA